MRLWTNGRGGNSLVDLIQQERTHQLRMTLLAANGISPAAAARIENLEAPVAVTAPPQGGGRSRMMVRSIVPLALVYLLLTAALITGGMMLQGVIEERSNRLLEAVLACVEPRELMLGKLLGLGGVGLTIIAAWIGCALLAAFSVQGVVADYLRPSLAALSQPWMIPVLAFYFFSGYLMLAMLYLTIGSLSNSMQDAQAYLMPVTMIIIVPVFMMMSVVIRNPSGWLPSVMSWIPFLCALRDAGAAWQRRFRGGDSGHRPAARGFCELGADTAGPCLPRQPAQYRPTAQAGRLQSS